MRSSLVLTLGIICLIDLGMIIFLNSHWLTKVILVPVIGSSSLICFVAGHHNEEANGKAIVSLLGTIVVVFLGIYFLLPASTVGKTILFISLCFSFISCYSFGHHNDDFNKKYQKELEDM